MNKIFIRTIIRSIFLLTSRERVISQANSFIRKYSSLAKGLTLEAGQLSTEVPPMRGVDEDMRRWSFYMILEHNAVVNTSISTTIRQLVNGEPLSGAAFIGPKKDVMPSESADEEQLLLFRTSVTDHVEMIKGLGRLRRTKTTSHIIFGDFDAHKWQLHVHFSFRPALQAS